MALTRGTGSGSKQPPAEEQLGPRSTTDFGAIDEANSQQQQEDLASFFSTDGGGGGGITSDEQYQLLLQASQQQQVNLGSVTDLYFDPTSATSLLPTRLVGHPDVLPGTDPGLGQSLLSDFGKNNFLEFSQSWFKPNFTHDAAGQLQRGHIQGIISKWWTFTEGEGSEVETWQRLMLNAGYVFETDKIGFRSVSSVTQAGSDAHAFAAAAKDAARNGMSVYEWLRERARRIKEAGGLGRGGGAGGPRVQVISDVDARELIDRVTQSVMGRELSDEEEKLAQGIVSAIQARQRSGQQAFIGGSDKAGPSAEAVAIDEVENRFEAEVGAHNTAEQFASLMQLIGRG